MEPERTLYATSRNPSEQVPGPVFAVFYRETSSFARANEVCSEGETTRLPSLPPWHNMLAFPACRLLPSALDAAAAAADVE